ncbi:MAG: T9SS type A sorting domain-containing protein [Bacteroidota bacterium]
MNRTNRIVPIILLLIIFYGESYAQWQRANLPASVKVNTIKIKDSFIVAGTDGAGIFVSADDGENWTSSNKGLQDTIIHTVMILGNTIFAGTETGVSVSTDNGENWRSINSGLSGLGVWSLEISVGTAGDTTIFAGSWSGVYSSTDRGEHWIVTRLSSTAAPVHSMVVLDRYIYAATLTEGIFLSRDNGLTWWNFDIKPKGATDYPIPLLAPIYSITLFAGLGTCILAGSIGSLYYGGDTLFQADTSLAKLTTQAEPIFCFANRNDTLFTAVGGDLFKLSWGYIYRRGFYGDIFDSVVAYDAHRLNIPYLGDLTVYSLALNNAHIFAGTEDGLWRLSYPEAMTRVEHFQDIPSGFVLEQNYPNPFNPTTNISYRLATNTLVALKVYDILGREIKTLVNERQAAGAHSVTFNAGTLASGMYFYRMQAGIFTQTKELVFSK